MQVPEFLIRAQCLVVALIFVDPLKDLADLEQLGDGRLFTRTQLREVGREPDCLRLFNERPALFQRPVTGGPGARRLATGLSLRRRDHKDKEYEQDTDDSNKH